jgi:thiol-disulfide isomerase/thioredoxin
MSDSISSLEELENLFDKYSKKLIVLDFYSNFCVPCRRAKPKIKSLMQETCKHTLFVMIEVRDDPDIAEILEKYQVYTIPKFIIIRDHKKIFVTNDPDKLKDKIKRLIPPIPPPRRKS